MQKAARSQQNARDGDCARVRIYSSRRFAKGDGAARSFWLGETAEKKGTTGILATSACCILVWREHPLFGEWTLIVAFGIYDQELHIDSFIIWDGFLV